MKILHLTGEGEDTGGVLSVIRNLMQSSQTIGWQHTVWVNRKYQETRCPQLNYRYSQHIRANSESHFDILLSAFRSLKEIHQLLRREKFDIIHAHTRGTLLVIWALAYTRKRKSVFTNHNYARRTGLYRKAAQCSRIYSVFLTPNMLRHYGFNSISDRKHIISACCSDRFLQVPTVERSASDKIRFVGIGSLVRWKRWHLVLESLHQLNKEERDKVKFSLFGPVLDSPESREYADTLKQMVDKFGIRASANIYGPTHLIEDRLREADWFLLPSINEPCSIALIEALSLGLPALTSASGGNIDILQDGKTGLMFEPDNVNDLVEKLRKIISGRIVPDAPDKIRDSVKIRAASMVVKQYERLYQNILE